MGSLATTVARAVAAYRPPPVRPAVALAPTISPRVQLFDGSPAARASADADVARLKRARVLAAIAGGAP